MSHDLNTQSTLTSSPPLVHISSASSSTAQYVALPNSPSTSSSNQGILAIRKSALLSPPPPSIHDDETAQEVNLALAKRNSKPWMNLSPKLPFHHVSKKPSADADEVMEGPSRSTTINKIFRPIPERNGTGNATITSIKLDGLIRKHTLSHGGGGEEKVLYRYSYVYENQRGWARFGTLKFSSRALKLFFHYRDPAAFTKYETFEEQGEKTVQINLPYSSLRDVQLPSPEWSWQGAEWLVDMANDGVTSYDGYQYATSFYSTRWTPIPPKWHTYFLTCCRRRRWLRLMVYLPSFISPDSSGNFRPPGHIAEASEPPSPLPLNSSTANLTKKEEDDSSTPSPSPSFSSPNLKAPHFPHHEPIELQNIWQSDSSDWTRVHSALRSMKSDGRRLELWKSWLGDEGEVEEDITGLGRISLERRRMEESNKGKASTILVKKKNVERVKGKRGIQWTEDEGPHSVFNSAGSGAGGTGAITAGEAPSISYFITDEPLAFEGQRAPREAVAKVLHEHAQEILSSFVYPDSRAKFHDMLQRCSLLDNLPSGLSFTVSTDFRERLES